jgi:hypothetical protein
MELTCPLSAVVVIEGTPQRPHRRLVALNCRPLVLCCSIVNRVGKQIPGRSPHRSHTGDLGRGLLLICLPSRAEQPVVLVVRYYVISQGVPFLDGECCAGRDDLTPGPRLGACPMAGPLTPAPLPQQATGRALIVASSPGQAIPGTGCPDGRASR